MSNLEVINCPFSADDLMRIRALPDFDLVMFLSEVHDHGVGHAMRLLPMIEKAVAMAHGGTDKPQEMQQ